MVVLKVQYQLTANLPINLILTDVTGEYSASNVTGWGAPNNNIADMAFFTVVTHKSASGNVLVTGYNQLIYDDTAVNTKQTTFSIPFPVDAVYTMNMGVLPVSLDGTTYKVGAAIIPDAIYYYYNGKIWVNTGGIPAEVTDMNVLITTGSVVKTPCGDALYPQLALYKASLYKNYTLARQQDDRSDELFLEVLKLKEDLEGVSYSYWSNLTVQAQSQIDSLLNRYKIVAYVQ